VGIKGKIHGVASLHQMALIARGGANERPSIEPAPKTFCSHPPPVSAMASSQLPKARDGVLLTLDVFIQALNFSKDTCGIPPAQIAFGSACVLLTMIRVCFFLLYKETLLIRVYLGHDG
jgi:hypothetical protein